MARILKIGTVSPKHAGAVFHAYPRLKCATYAAMLRALQDDFPPSGPAHAPWLSHLGHEVVEVFHNVPVLQRRWAHENDARSGTPNSITLRHAKLFRPDVLWYDYTDGDLLREIRREVPSIRLAIGWEGSALSAGSAWPHLDLVLSCAPESVEYLCAMGVRAAHLNHGFDPAVLAKLGNPGSAIGIGFMGSIVRRNRYHVRRDALLSALCRELPLAIFTPLAGPREYAKMFAASAVHAAIVATRRLQLARPESWPHALRRTASPFRRPVNPALRRACRPPVFGLDYYRTVRDSRISLNIHADSSPRFASNMRLFEVTGAGSCLLTDQRENLAALFMPDSEVVAYHSVAECIEKARWLLDHPAECRAIAARGTTRTLRDHTVAQRAAELDQIVRRCL